MGAPTREVETETVTGDLGTMTKELPKVGDSVLLLSNGLLPPFEKKVQTRGADNGRQWFTVEGSYYRYFVEDEEKSNGYGWKRI